MARLFAYCRVSTEDQTTANQVEALTRAGYHFEPHRIIAETISGTVQAMARPKFAQMVDRLEAGDTLVVLKLDRLGRDNIDVQQTIGMLTDKGIHVRCLDIPVADLSSSEGKLMLTLIAAFAEFERGRISERTKEGQARARAEGKVIGRPVAVDTRAKVQECKAKGMTQVETAKQLSISDRTVKRHWHVTDDSVTRDTELMTRDIEPVSPLRLITDKAQAVCVDLRQQLEAGAKLHDVQEALTAAWMEAVEGLQDIRKNDWIVQPMDIKARTKETMIAKLQTAFDQIGQRANQE